MMTTALAGIMMTMAILAGAETASDDCYSFVFEAVHNGLKRDGMPRQLAGKLANNEKDFVPTCNLCGPTRKALLEYANQSAPPQGHGITAKMIQRLDSTDDKVRRDAIKELIGAYIDTAYMSTKMTPEQHVAMQTAIAKQRDLCMGVKPDHLEYCPSCEGGSCQLPPDDKGEWGPPANGVESRLSLVTRDPQVGKKLRLRLEIKNTGSVATKYDDQQAKVNNSLTIKGPDGNDAPYIALGFQTMGHSQQLAPNETKIIFADLDAADQYLFTLPGDYLIQFVGRGGIPKSNELKVMVKLGQLSDLQSMILSSQKIVPEGWRVSTYFGAITILNTPTSLKRDATSVTIFFTEKKEHHQKLQANQPEPKYLMETRLGHAWLQPQDHQVAQRWKDFEKMIEEQMKKLSHQPGEVKGERQPAE